MTIVVHAGARSQPVDRLLEFDVFRGLAALSILIYHYTARFDELYGHAPGVLLTSSGPYGGIDMFFVMSGFLMLGILQRTRHGLDFVVSRASRLYPGYWVGVLVTFTALSLFPLPGREVTLSEAVANLTMLSVFLGVPYVDGVYWTLSLNICFYAIMLVLYQARQLERVELISAIWMCGTVGAHLLKVELPLVVQVATLSQYAHLFIAGMIIYRTTQRGFTFGRGVLLTSCVAAAWYIHGARFGLLDGAIVLIVLATVRGWFRWIVFKPLVFLGTISYSLFLIHQNVGYILMREAYAHGLNPYVGLALATGLMIGVATVVTFYVELPAMQLARQWYKRFRDRLIVAPKAA